jgi:N-acetylmuramoyl-L-alanine amidase
LSPGHGRQILYAIAMLVTGIVMLTLAAADAVVAQQPSLVPGWQTQVDTGKPARRPPARSKTGSKTFDGVKVVAAELAAAGDETRFSLRFSAPVGAKVYTLAHPHRVVIDLPDVVFLLPEAAGRQGQGLVSAFRHGLIAAGQARVVLDLARPARVELADMSPLEAGSGSRLVLALRATDEATFMTEATPPGSAQPASEMALRTEPEDLPAAGKRHARKRPVVVIDPGHGGIDPGAVGSTDVTEKNIVLAVARQVKAILGASHRYSVVLTRNQDVFVPLDARRELSRRLEADLFISIHADAIDAKFAQSVRGATVYTLAERASDERARLLAEKENAADAIAGVVQIPESDADQVKDILIDLMQRETANLSHQFSGLLVGRLQRALSMSRDPQRGAAFKVLKQTQSPSVLIELGYMSNAEDERLLGSPDWQRKVASSIAAAVEAYFSEQLAVRP